MKKSLILYCDQLKIFEAMPDNKALELLRHVFKYAESRKPPKIKDPVVNVGFVAIQAVIDRDHIKYTARCKKNKENIKKRWAQK